MNTASLIRHLVTGLATIGTFLAGLHWIAPDAVEALNKAGGDLVEPLVIFLSLLAAALMRALIAWVANFFQSGSGKSATPPAGGLMALACWLVVSTAAVGLLPSCVPTSGGEGYPVSGFVSYTDPATGAEVGMQVGKMDRNAEAQRSRRERGGKTVMATK